MTTVPDPELIAAHLAGDRRAFAALYDRYAPALYDVARSMTRNPDDAADLVHDTFVIAAQRLGQLRQRDRLRPWLFAVLRHEVYRSTRRRARERPTDVVADMAPPAAPDPGADLDADGLARLVRDAAGGLDERDRLVLELVARQHLEGADLADALGVTVAQTYSLVHRMRQRFTRAAGAVVVARTGRGDCAELDGVLQAWDGAYDVLTRKRVARHLDDCAACQRTRERAGLLELFRASPASALPGGLRERVLADAVGQAAAISLGADGFPAGGRRWTRTTLLVAVLAAAVLLASGLAATLVRTSARPTLGGPAAPTTTTSAATPPSAATAANGPVAPGPGVTTTGGAATTTVGTGPTTTTAEGVAATTQATPVTAPPTVTAAGSGPTVRAGGATTSTPAGPGTTAAPAAATTTTTAAPPTGTAPTRTTRPVLVAATTTTTVPTPVVRLGDPSTTVLWSPGSCAPTTVTIAATVLSTVAGAKVTLRWSGPSTLSGRRAMTAGTGSAWTAPLGPFPVSGTVTYTVEATNPGRAAVSSAPRTLAVRQCAR